jgi:ketosteroid isomerase-like protein
MVRDAEVGALDLQAIRQLGRGRLRTRTQVRARGGVAAERGEESGSGIEIIRRLAEGWFEVFPDFRADTEEFIDAGDRVVCVTRWQGTGAASGLDYDQRAAEVYTLRDGKIVPRRVWVSRQSRRRRGRRPRALDAPSVGEQHAARACCSRGIASVFAEHIVVLVLDDARAPRRPRFAQPHCPGRASVSASGREKPGSESPQAGDRFVMWMRSRQTVVCL